MLCPGYAPLAAGSSEEPMTGAGMSDMDMSDMPMSVHDMGMDHGGKGPTHESVGICPFAAAGVAMAVRHTPPPATYSPVVALEITLAPQPFIPRAAIARTRLPRGPPAFV